MKTIARYYDGDFGNLVDKYEAIKWHLKIADGNSYCMIAHHYLNDKNVPRAIEYFTKAADTGFVKANLRLGELYIKTDIEKSFQWYKKAADKDDPTGQHNIAVMYETGTHVEKDLMIAVEWYKKAAEQGFQPSIYRLGPSHNKSNSNSNSNSSSSNKRQKI
jgi:TPR repeat protein